LEKKTPLEKRIKRHITGRVHSFFIAVTPGLEALCLEELQSLPLPNPVFSSVRGGIELEGRLHDCYLLNLHLRTASRVLMRIAGFKASNFGNLEKKLLSIPWELYLTRSAIPLISTSTKHSRLYHKEAIDERVMASILNRSNLAEFLESPELKESYAQQIFIRVVDDHFTLSLDSSGDLLYKRGLKEHNTIAPIRETLAAAALKMAGYKGDEPLLDPMSGSGTFSIEAAMTATRTPAGLYRNFAFVDWPGFGAERWLHIKKESQKEIVDLKPFSIIASEKDQRLYTALKERMDKFDLSKHITVINMDFFDIKRKDLSVMFKTKQSGLVIINPPYGVRLGTKKAGRELFRNIIKKLQSDFKGWRYALFVHDQNLIREVPFKKSSLLLDHGGLKLALLTGTV
jgi:putative N6-adenine-specific DNA methylase